MIQVRDDGGTDQGGDSGGGKKQLNSKCIWQIELVRLGDNTLDDRCEKKKGVRNRSPQKP